MARTYELITTAVGNGSNSVTLSSIPQTYTDILLYICGPSNGASSRLTLSCGATTRNLGFRGVAPSSPSNFTYTTSFGEVAPFSNLTWSTNGAQPFQGIVNFFNYRAGTSGRTQVFLSQLGHSNDNAVLSVSQSTSNGSYSEIGVTSNNGIASGTRFRVYGILRA